MASGGNLVCCKICQQPGYDLRVLGCGCTFHASCAPLSLVLDSGPQGQQGYGALPGPNKSKSTLCPICRTRPVEGIYIVPLSFAGVERAVELRKINANARNFNGNHKKVHEDDASYAALTYLLLSSRSSMPTSGLKDREQQRTGRWTEEEIAFVDYLVSAFDRGCLPLPHGIKLNEFLGEMLLCKSSRLTKKMKNAKLSTRSFSLSSPQAHLVRNDYAIFSNLQEKFLMSIQSEATQLELRFNLTKQWRTHFSNLCVQVGYPYLDGKDWVASLEEMERRASNAEDMVRRVRRKRMGLALQTDGGTAANPSVFIGGIKADTISSQAQPMVTFETPELLSTEQCGGIRRLSESDAGSERPNNGDDDMFAMLEGLDNANDGTNEPLAKRARSRTFSEEFFQQETRKPRSFSEDFESVLDDLIDSDPIVPQSKSNTNLDNETPIHSCGPFLDAITIFMESKNLPFHHADVWVPSFLPRDSKGPSKAVDTDKLRLFHAGHATRADLEQSAAYAYHEFGMYSDNFSFEPGHGLPGRVYASGTIIWEGGVDNIEPKRFERAGGAKVYGIKTAVGIPLSTPLVGRIVVALYSREVIPENISFAKDCARELMKYSPAPKWKLVIEMDDDPNEVPTSQLVQQKQVSDRFGSTQSQLVYDSASTQVVSCTSPQGSNSVTIDPEEQRIVTLLGEHMPLSDRSTGEPSSSAGNSQGLLSSFMYIRLLLLRPASRRSTQENEMIDVLKNSFRAYSKDNRRSGSELANLLAKDWMCLKSTFAVSKALPHRIQNNVVGRRHSDAAILKNRTELFQAPFIAPTSMASNGKISTQFHAPSQSIDYRRSSQGPLVSRPTTNPPNEPKRKIPTQSILSSRPAEPSMPPSL